MADRMRNAVGAAHDRMAPEFVVLLERLCGLIDNKALFVAVKLEIADALEDGPRRAADIAKAVEADPDAVERLLRYLVCRGIFTTTDSGQYENNRASDALRTNAPVRWRDWVLFFGSDWNNQIFNQLLERVRTGTPASEEAFGVGFFEYINQQNPDAGAAFNGAMAAGSRLQSLLFAETMDLTRFREACDIGGGTGQALVHMLRTNQHLRGTVFDLPEVGQAARSFIDASELGERIAFRGGDFFEAVPAGCDLYTLFAIIHDWDDERCVQILKNIADAMNPDGRIMVVEKALRPGNAYDFAKASDMIMLALGDGGRERTEAEFEALFERSGLRVDRRVVLPSLFDVFELVPETGRR